MVRHNSEAFLQGSSSSLQLYVTAIPDLSSQERSGMAVTYNCNDDDEPCKKASELCRTMDCRCFNVEATSCSQCHCRRPCARNDINCCQNTMECHCNEEAVTARDCAMCAPPCGRS